MIDKTEIECRFRRSVDSYEDNATVQKWIVQRLVELLRSGLRRGPTSAWGCSSRRS